MQHISCLAQLPATDIPALVDELQRAQAQMFSMEALRWILLLNVVTIIAWWISSKIVAQENGRLLNALKLWGIYTAGGVVFLILTLFAYMAATVTGSSAVLLAVAFGTFLVFVALLLVAPMLVYRIGFLRSIGFVIVATLILFGGQLVLGAFVSPPPGTAEQTAVMRKVSALSPEEQKRFLEHLSQRAAKGSIPQSAEAIAADRSKTIEERTVALQQIEARLEKQRQQLRLDDRVALDAYNRENAQYQALREELQGKAPAAR